MLGLCQSDSLTQEETAAGFPKPPPLFLLEPKYLVQGTVGVRVTEGERGLLSELLPELVLLDLQEKHVGTCHGLSRP